MLAGIDAFLADVPMLTPFDAGIAILLACLGVIGLNFQFHTSRAVQSIGFLAGAAVTVAARVFGGAAMGLDVTATLVLVVTAIGIGRVVMARGAWPAGMLAIALAIITATGAYLRAYRLNEVIQATDRPLQPDVEYYRQQAMRTANPWAAGHKSPLWPALNAPIVRAASGDADAMRILSWCCGIAMLPLAGWALARLLHPLAGVLTAGMVAANPWLIDLCCDGLREEAGVCLLMVTLVLLYAGPDRRWRPGAAGVAAGLLLLLRNTFIVPLLALLIWAILYRKWRLLQAAALLALPLLIVAPFYVNQSRTFGDAFALEKRDARYHANLEFQDDPPPGLSMPTTREWRENLYAGDPLSPLAYLLKYHALSDVLARQWTGVTRIVTGRPFTSFAEPWFGLFGAAATLASLLVRRARFGGLYILAGSVGITAHLMTVHPVELRVLLPVLVMWLGAAWWLIVSVVQVGLARTRPLLPVQNRRPGETRMTKPE